MRIKYQVRSKDGILKFTLPQTMALNTISSSPGHWREANYPSGKLQQYVLESDTAFTMTQMDETLVLHLWEGDKIDLRVE